MLCSRFHLAARITVPSILLSGWARLLEQKILTLSLYFLSQKVSEKVGGAEGTKLDDDFKEMEKVNTHKSKYSHTHKKINNRIGVNIY